MRCKESEKKEHKKMKGFGRAMEKDEDYEEKKPSVKNMKKIKKSLVIRAKRGK